MPLTQGDSRLGVLTDDKLVLILPSRRGQSSPLLGVPVSRFIEGEMEPFPALGKLKVVESGLFDQQYQDCDPPHFTKYIGEKSGVFPSYVSSLVPPRGPTNVELVVGNEAVKARLKSAAMQDLYRPAAHALGMLELEPTEPG